LECYKCLYLWNPSTGVNKQLHLSPITIAGNDHILKFLYGLAYDLSTDDYLIVFGSYECDDDYEPVSGNIDLEIFSLRANKWKQIKVSSHLPYRIRSDFHLLSARVGSFLNGAIHWLVYNYESFKDVIIAFDLKEMKMSEIALPNDFYVAYSPVDYDLLVFGGLISVWKVEMSTIKIWMMQEYAVHSSWTKTFDFSFDPALNFFPVCFTNRGDIVGPDAGSGLAKLNDKGQLQEYYVVKTSRMTVYTESLLSLPDDTKQA